MAGYVLILLIWILIAGWVRITSGKPFPFPWEAVISLFDSPEARLGIMLHTGASLLRWISGFVLASVLGVGVGLIMGIFRKAGLLLMPLVTMLQLIPGLAWIPIVLILFGLGNGATIFMIGVTAFAPIVINTMTGIMQINPALFRAADMMELSFSQKLVKIVLPGAEPSIITGLRVGAANGFRVLVSAEMVVGTVLGLGYALFQSRWTLDYEFAFGALALIALIGIVLEKVVFSLIENRVRRKRGML